MARRFGKPIRPVERDIIAELKYWRAIRLDKPWRKKEALKNIDRLLGELHATKAGTEATEGSKEEGAREGADQSLRVWHAEENGLEATEKAWLAR